MEQSDLDVLYFHCYKLKDYDKICETTILDENSI